MSQRTKPPRTGSPDKAHGETIDGASGKPDVTPRRVDLSSLRDVRLEMAYVYRQVDGGKIESQDGSRRVFMLRQIADVIVNTELERRVAELEEYAAGDPLNGRAALPAARSLN